MFGFFGIDQVLEIMFDLRHPPQCFQYLSPRGRGFLEPTVKGLDGKNDNGQGVGGKESTNREIRRFPIRRWTVFVVSIPFHFCGFGLVSFFWTSLERKLMEEHIASETCCNLREDSHSNGKASFCQ